MKTNVNKDMFINAFKTSQYKENFSVEGLENLYEWYIEQEEETEVEIELDLPAIAQEWQEHSSAVDYIKDFGGLLEELEDPDEEEDITIKLFDYIKDNGAIVIKLRSGGLLSTPI